MNTKKNTKKEPINTINYYFLLQFRNIVKYDTWTAFNL